METLDWVVLIGTLLAIVAYGSWKTRHQHTIASYLKGDNSMKWGTIGLSIMATQASAITFLSTPGQAYESGMGFVQFYFGLPLAMIVISAVFIPIYHSLSVYTAYEYLEKRFDLRIRLFTAFLFLVSRGLAAGITIYAPAIVLSKLIGWDLTTTCLLVGFLVIIYTVSGGTSAVSVTQKWQMGIIFLGMFIAFFIILDRLPDAVGFHEIFTIGGAMDKMQIIDTTFNLQNRYTLWTGLLGGFFLSLSYFGTDQSQVQRYLGGKNITEIRFGLLFNALLKIPMQLFILFVGILVFTFYQFEEPPAFFNEPGKAMVYETAYGDSVKQAEAKHHAIFIEKKQKLESYVKTQDEHHLNEAVVLEEKASAIRDELKGYIQKADVGVETRDTDYVFLTFILNHLPVGIVGLLLAVICSAAMSSTAGELNALASTTMVDYYQRLTKRELSEKQQVSTSKWITAVWGLMAIGIALSASLFENLIQLVNVLGSLFYGTILGVFVIAFFIKRVNAKSAFIGGVIGQVSVLVCHLGTVLHWFELSYLWYNLIGCSVVVFSALIFQLGVNNSTEKL